MTPFAATDLKTGLLVLRSKGRSENQREIAATCAATSHGQPFGWRCGLGGHGGKATPSSPVGHGVYLGSRVAKRPWSGGHPTPALPPGPNRLPSRRQATPGSHLHEILERLKERRPKKPGGSFGSKDLKPRETSHWHLPSLSGSNTRGV